MFSLDSLTSIRQQILLSSTVVLVLFVLSSGYSLNQLASSTSSFLQLEKIWSETETMMEINADLAELQLDIFRFSSANHQSAEYRIGDSFAKLGSDLNNLSTSVSDESRSATLARMKEVYASYSQSIASMRESRKLSEELVEELLPELSSQMFAALTKLEENASKQENLQLLSILRLTNEELLKSEIHIISYQVSRKYEDQSLAIATFEQAQQLLSQASPAVVASAESRAGLTVLQQAIADYLTAFQQAIQAIRGSLFLINVVMAGEAEEFLFLASELKESTLALQNGIRSSVESDMNIARTATTLVTLGAIFLGLLFSLLVSNSISKPIREISQVFKKLSQGDFNSEIPGKKRSDEIGVLAESATVFKDVSMKTISLLSESEKLAAKLRARELQLQLKTVELEKSNDQLDNFAYVASHDLKSPLRAIVNLAGWIGEDCADLLPADSKVHLEKLKMRTLRMETLLADLLRYSRVGKIEENLERVSLFVLLAEIKHITDVPEGFEIVIPKQDLEMFTLVVSLKQVFLNLFENAFKYVDKKPGRLTVDWIEGDDGFLEFSVTDNGPGIDPRFHSKVFQMFQTLNPRDVYEGSGMGLATIKKVIEGVGGTICIASKAGEGARFVFTWPKNISH